MSPAIVGFLRQRVSWNRELARAVAEAEETALQAMADRYRWRLVTVVRLPLWVSEVSDPIEHLVAQVSIHRADAVVVSNRLHLKDLCGRDCLDMLCQRCFVATTSPEQLWPYIGGATQVSRSL